MKIVIFTTYFYPEKNGLTRYIEGLYSALIKKYPEVDVEVIAFDTLKTERVYEEWKSFKIYRIESWQFLGRTYAMPTLKGFFQLGKIFKKNKYDIINTHTRFFLSSFLGVWFGKKYNIPVVHTEHGSGFVKNGNLLVEIIAKIYDYTLGKYTLKNAKIVCGVSQSVCAFAKKLGAKKVKVVYNGTNVDFWEESTDRAKTRNELSIKESDVVVVFVGRLVPSKGCQDIIEALDEVKAFSWKFLIVGDGLYEDDLLSLVKQKGLGGRVIFLGAKRKEEIRNILQVSDLFINASFASEGLPTTILEASATGVKCLSSDKGGSVEILDENNIYTARDIEALRKKIFSYKELRRVSVDSFDWKNVAEKYNKILLDLS